MFRNDWIKIGETTYYVQDLKNIPDAYKIKDSPNSLPAPTSLEGAVGGAMSDPDPASKKKKHVRDQTYMLAKPLPNERIKLTKAGYTYAGESAYLSHFFNCDFTYQKTQYTSIEQGLHHIHATHEMEFDIAEKIMSLYFARDIKLVSKQLQDNEEWNEMCPVILSGLNRAKYDQNPDLKKRLIDTAPHKLVEATVDAKWGGACQFGSQIYEEGQVPGSNKAGESLTGLRDDMITDMNDIRMT